MAVSSRLLVHLQMRVVHHERRLPEHGHLWCACMDGRIDGGQKLPCPMARAQRRHSRTGREASIHLSPTHPPHTSTPIDYHPPFAYPPTPHSHTY